LRITVKIDVGLGNWLTIRGCGGGLGWDKGVPLKNMGPDVWVWETCTYDDVEFKLLINDAHWECGDNHRCSGGESVTVTPLF
jgi:hypothetical protein